MGGGGRGRGAPYNGLYGETPPERGTLFRLQVYKRVGTVSQVEVYKRLGKSSFRYFKGPLITIFRKDASYDCTSLFIKRYMNMRTRLPKIDM